MTAKDIQGNLKSEISSYGSQEINLKNHEFTLYNVI